MLKQRRWMMTIVAGVLSLFIIIGLSVNLSRRGIAGEEFVSDEPTPKVFTYPDEPPTPTIAPRPTDVPQPAATVLFADTFETPDALTNWEFVDLDMAEILAHFPDQRSVWVIEEGKLKQDLTAQARNPSIQETLAITGLAEWTDYTITAKVYDRQNATFGLVARRQGDSFYRYRVIADIYEATPKHVLEVVVDGLATPLVEMDIPGYEHYRWYTVSLSVAGPTLRVMLDGDVVAEATDTTLTAGQAGLYTRAMGGIFFDDVTITAP